MSVGGVKMFWPKTESRRNRNLTNRVKGKPQKLAKLLGLKKKKKKTPTQYRQTLQLHEL